MNAEQRLLLEKARISLRAAKLLADDGIQDFAASRAYYAMFYIAEVFLLSQDLHFSKHSAVISAFGYHFARTKRLPPEFHGYLIRGQEKRLAGDYDANPELSAEDTTEMIEQAEAFITLAEEHLDLA